MQLVIFFVILALLVIGISDILRLKIGPNPTSKKVAEQLLGMLPQSIEGPIYELGSGFGTLTLKLARRYPQIKIVAFEKAIIPFAISKLLFWICRLQNVELRFKDFRKESFEKGQYFICYLYRQIMPLIAQKIEQEGKGSRWLITHTFSLQDRKANQLKYTPDLHHTPIYFYEFLK